MRINPFLKADRAVIKKVYRNAAILNFIVVSSAYSTETGEITETKSVFSRTVHISNPREISDRIVDGKNFVKGDLNAEISVLEVRQQVQIVSADDPRVTPGGDYMILAQLRDATNRTAGIQAESDTLTFAGTTYRIVKIEGKICYCGEPSRMRLLLRSV